MKQKSQTEISLRLLIHRRIFLGCCMLLVFFIPVFGRILPPIIALMVLNWLVEGRFIGNISRFFKDSFRWMTFLFSLLFLLYLIGMSYSKNKHYGWFDLEIKCSLLLFPLLFSTIDDFLDRKQINRILQTFVAGCFTGSILLIIHAFLAYRETGSIDSFAYTNLSWYFHSSYMSMYLSFAISILLYFIMVRWQTIPWPGKTGILLLLLWFFVFIIFLSSKAGFLGLFFVIFFYVLILGLKYRKWLSAACILIGTILLFYVSFEMFPFAMNRITQAGQDITGKAGSSNHSRSVGDRIDIWKASYGIIGQNLLFGVGTGDVKDELINAYKTKNIHAALESKLNAHNQYLQTFVSLGIPGFLVLLAMLLIPAWMSLKRNQYLFFSFLLLFAINIMVESMLEVQQGVIFYAFFNALLCWSMIKGDEQLAHDH